MAIAFVLLAGGPLLACVWAVMRGKMKRAHGLPDYYNKG
jgi:hypothetical protein